jgi:hypothetical protein
MGGFELDFVKNVLKKRNYYPITQLISAFLGLHGAFKVSPRIFKALLTALILVSEMPTLSFVASLWSARACTK